MKKLKPGTKRCPSCSKIVAAATKICKHCGGVATRQPETPRRVLKAATPPAPVPTPAENGHISAEQVQQVVSAQTLIRQCGGAKAAVELIVSIARASRA